jgi:hypothetical protein
MLNSGFRLALGTLVALALAAGPAHADSVTLSCRRADETPGTWTLRIDYSSGRVEQLNPSGEAYNRRVVAAKISPNTIVWSIDQPASYLTGDNVRHQTSEHWAGHIDRLSGTGWLESYYEAQFHYLPIDVTCRQAKKIF